MENYKDLFTDSRLSDNGGKRTPSNGRSRFNQDYGRVLYSSAFRRLQDKTQVFPLGRNDYVRTRLTHSLEVANVGRSLAKAFALKVHAGIRGKNQNLADFISDVENIVATACLAHDIGNPPFGHSGEDAIMHALKGTEFEDFKFEGNAQGFRVLTRTCDPIRGHGLDLTAATLAAYMKYPCTAKAMSLAKEWEDKHICVKKFGIAEEDFLTFARVAEKCGLKTKTGYTESWCRHPLSYLMEAADDISYLIADMEDAYLSGVINYGMCKENMFRFLSEDDRMLVKREFPKHLLRIQEYKKCSVYMMRAYAVGKCISKVIKLFEDNDNVKSIMEGRFPTSLIEATEISKEYRRIKDFSICRIYNNESVVRVETTGYSVLKGLVDLFLNWVDKPDSALGKKIALFIHASDMDKEKLSIKKERFLHMIDFVSGMTDSYALETYQKLLGMAPLS